MHPAFLMKSLPLPFEFHTCSCLRHSWESCKNTLTPKWLWNLPIALGKQNKSRFTAGGLGTCQMSCLITAVLLTVYIVGGMCLIKKKFSTNIVGYLVILLKEIIKKKRTNCLMFALLDLVKTGSRGEKHKMKACQLIGS